LGVDEQAWGRISPCAKGAYEAKCNGIGQSLKMPA